MDDERPMIHVRLPKLLVKRIDHVRVEWELDRARTIERLLETALASVEATPEARQLEVVGANGSN